MTIKPSIPPVISNKPQDIHAIWLLWAEPAMTNIVKFRGRSSGPIKKSPGSKTDVSEVLAGLASRLGQIGQMQLKTKEDVQRAIFFIALSNTCLQQLISPIKDEESRARLLAETQRIDELVDLVGRSAAAL